eukprot:10699754-Alexandrium_andersonii.AAC.1
MRGGPQETRGSTNVQSCRAVVRRASLAQRVPRFTLLRCARRSAVVLRPSTPVAVGVLLRLWRRG